MPIGHNSAKHFSRKGFRETDRILFYYFTSCILGAGQRKNNGSIWTIWNHPVTIEKWRSSPPCKNSCGNVERTSSFGGTKPAVRTRVPWTIWIFNSVSWEKISSHRYDQAFKNFCDIRKTIKAYTKCYTIKIRIQNRYRADLLVCYVTLVSICRR